MPTLFTALLARKTKRKTLAPKNQRPPVRADIGKLKEKQYHERVSESYSGVLAEMIRLEEPIRSIGVVGAGLAGLSAAYELRRRGYDVRVFEASDRVGGRTWSDHNLVAHHVMERGAELIGANHPLWLTYADTFHLAFSDVKGRPATRGGNALRHSGTKIPRFILGTTVFPRMRRTFCMNI